MKTLFLGQITTSGVSWGTFRKTVFKEHSWKTARVGQNLTNFECWKAWIYQWLIHYNQKIPHKSIIRKRYRLIWHRCVMKDIQKAILRNKFWSILIIDINLGWYCLPDFLWKMFTNNERVKGNNDGDRIWPSIKEEVSKAVIIYVFSCKRQ